MERYSPCSSRQHNRYISRIHKSWRLDDALPYRRTSRIGNDDDVYNEVKKMKKVIVIFLLALVIMTACTSKKSSYNDLTFQEVCSKTGGMWMKMQPTQNYAPTGQPACFGCMQRNGDHICEKERYVQTLPA